jgi:hypothetical protein
MPRADASYLRVVRPGDPEVVTEHVVTAEERMAIQEAMVAIFRPDLAAAARRQGRCVHCGAVVPRAARRETTVPTCDTCARHIGEGRLP